MKQKPLLVALTCLALSSTAFAQGAVEGEQVVEVQALQVQAVLQARAPAAADQQEAPLRPELRLQAMPTQASQTPAPPTRRRTRTPTTSTQVHQRRTWRPRTAKAAFRPPTTMGSADRQQPRPIQTTHRFPRPILKIRPKQPSQPSKTPLFQEAKLPLPHPVPSARQASGSAMPQTVYRLALQVLGSDHQSNRLAKNRSSLLFSKITNARQADGRFRHDHEGCESP